MNTNPPAAKTITIKDVELCTPRRRKICRARRYYVRFTVDGAVKDTNVAPERNNITSWTNMLFFHVDRGSIIVEVYRKRSIRKDKPVAKLTDTIDEVSGKLKDGGTKLELCTRGFTHAIFGKGALDISDGSAQSGITIKFAVVLEKDGDANDLQAADALAVMDDALKAFSPAQPLVDHMDSAINTATDVVNEVQTFENTWNVLLEKMSSFNEIVSRVAEVHPYMSLAWSVISTANQVLVDQKNRDDKIIRLVGIMREVFTFIHDGERLKAIEAHLKTITLVIQRVTECGYFIADYASDKNFLTRTAKYAFSNIDEAIAGYEKLLADLKKEFLDGVTLQTELAVISIAESIDLSGIPHVGARYTSKKGCLEGTRETIIREIRGVLDNLAEDAPRVCLLTGVPGSGKSAIARTIAHQYDSKGRLGSSYFFGGGGEPPPSPQNLFSTIAVDLSDHDTLFKSALHKAVKSNRALRKSTSPSEQLLRLIVEPSKGLPATVPSVVVVDGLDESGNPNERRELLAALQEHIVKCNLPMHLRFLITARPESDILVALSNAQIVHKHLRDTEDAIVDEDITKFIYHTLRQYEELETSWPQGRWCRLLVSESQRLFQWASTACDFIEGYIIEGQGLSRHERFLIVIGSSKNERFYPLDGLYQSILKQRFQWESAKSRFKKVMAIILTLKAPLPLPSLDALFGSDLQFQEIVKPLGSLLDGGHDNEMPVRIIHTSFEAFLLDERRSSPFHVEIYPDHPHSHGRLLLARMRDILKFNMCGLKDSQLCNAAVPDLAHVVKEYFPAHLAYACQHWMDHLQDAQCTLELLDEVTHFFKNFLPYWLEAISLLSLSSPESIPHALQSCTYLSTWAKDQEVVTLASETIQFINEFDPILRKSTPHLYLSAMPQTPVNSPLCKLWNDHLQKQLFIISKSTADWPAKTLALDIPFISSVAYSPNKEHIVSGSSDGSIRIWSASTGQCVTGPFPKGHTLLVCSIAYSPDGSQVVSGSADATIRIWNIVSGQYMIGLGHTDSVRSVVYSSDGRHVASSSTDGTIRIWDATTGKLVAGPFQEHTDGSNDDPIAYSSDRRHVASGSWDNSTKIWSTTNGQYVASPLQEYTISTRPVIFFLDGRHINFGSANEVNGKSISSLGLQPIISSIAYSSDGAHMITGLSNKNTIKILDASNGQYVAGPFQRHTNYVFTAVHSSNGCPSTSGSDGCIIKVWKGKELPSLGYIYDQSGWLLSSDDKNCFGWIAPWFRSALHLPYHSLNNSSDNTYQLAVDSSLFGKTWISCWK